MFLTVFHCFPLFMPKIRSCCSLQKGNREQIAPVAHYKRVTVSDLLFCKEQRELFAIFERESLFRSLAHKKQAIHSKTRRVNSQPWIINNL